MRHVKRDEKKYYEELVLYSRQHLMVKYLLWNLFVYFSFANRLLNDRSWKHCVHTWERFWPKIDLKYKLKLEVASKSTLTYLLFEGAFSVISLPTLALIRAVLTEKDKSRGLYRGEGKAASKKDNIWSEILLYVFFKMRKNKSKSWSCYLW